jgi:hypothetical protein
MPCNDEQWSWMPRERCIGNQAKWAEHARGDMRWSKQVAKQFDRREVWDGETRWLGDYCNRVDTTEDACSYSLQFLRMAAVRYGKNGEPLLWNLMYPVIGIDEVDGYNCREDRSQRMTYPVVLWWLKSQWDLSCKLEKENATGSWARWENKSMGRRWRTFLRCCSLEKWWNRGLGLVTTTPSLECTRCHTRRGSCRDGTAALVLGGMVVFTPTCCASCAIGMSVLAPGGGKTK